MTFTLNHDLLVIGRYSMREEPNLKYNEEEIGNELKNQLALSVTDATNSLKRSAGAPSDKQI